MGYLRLHEVRSYAVDVPSILFGQLRIGGRVVLSIKEVYDFSARRAEKSYTNERRRALPDLRRAAVFQGCQAGSDIIERLDEHVGLLKQHADATLCLEIDLIA